jgi:hypothetical protein
MIMKKVEILSSTDAAELENNINEFIAGKNIIEIKYSPVFATNTFQAMIVDRVLIIYED